MNLIKSVFAFLWQIPASILVLLVRFYQRFLSPLKGPTCRFTPTCSHYFIQAVRKYGAVRGTAMGFVRICKCHPFHPGGRDLP